MNSLPDDIICLIIENTNPLYYYFIYSVCMKFRHSLELIYKKYENLREILSMDTRYNSLLMA